MSEPPSQDAERSPEGLAAQAEAEGYRLVPLIPESRIAQRVAELGIALTHEYAGRLGPDRPLVLLIALKGALTFTVDLVRSIDCHAEFCLVRASSYAGTQPVRTPRIETLDPPELLRDKHVVIVEGIVDSGATLAALRAWVGEQKPASLATCALLVREHLTSDDDVPPADHWGFEIPDGPFLVGYGLDLDERFRNLPYLAVVERS
jgi:hypoxanthine phosphoribosyltransferase